MDIFHKAQDRVAYLNLLREQGDRFGVLFLSYCLMTNHVHLLAVPETEKSLARAIGEAHRLYTRMINFRENVRGYLFQGRFSSCAGSTGQYLISAFQYILRNPVKAKMVQECWDYEWSSARYHCKIVNSDILIQDDRLIPIIGNRKELLSVDSAQSSLLEERNRTGRPFGSDKFYSLIKKLTGNDARPGSPGKPKKQ